MPTSTNKRQKIPKVVYEPPPPLPAPTRAEAREMFVRHATDVYDHAKDQIAQWANELAKQEDVMYIHRLRWGQDALEAAAMLAVSQYILSALDLGSELEPLRDEVMTRTLYKAEWGSRSTSVMADMCDRAEGAAYAKFAKDLVSWCNMKTQG